MQEHPGQIGEYWLSKRRGSSAWCRTWYDPASRQTKRESLGTTDFQEGKLKLWEWFAKHGRIAQQQPQEAALAMVLVRYWQRHAVGLPSSEFAKIALRYWSDFWGDASVSDVTPARQREFISSLDGGGKSPGYIKRILTVGKAALNHAYREGEISSVPYIIPGEDGEARDRVLSVAESAGLWLATTLEHERMMLALLYGTLARPEAALELCREFASPIPPPQLRIATVVVDTEARLEIRHDAVARRQASEVPAAQRLTRTTGVPHEVDHEVPLLGKAVCGLHWEGNLRVVARSENRRKGNSHRPTTP